MSQSLRLGATPQDYGQHKASVISYSNFGQGLVNSNYGYSLLGPQTAARETDAFLFKNYTGAWHNHFAYSGTAAINVYEGSTMFVVDNTIFSARYEEQDGVSGGQLYINDAAIYTSVATNVIDGASWNPSNAQQSNPNGANYTLCAPGVNGTLTDDHSFGIEAFGQGHRYFNNSIKDNRGYGMILRDSADSTGMHPHSMDDTIVSGYDPFCGSPLLPPCTFAPQYLDNNAQCGTNCYNGGNWPAAMNVGNLVINGENATSANNITLDHIRSINSGRYGANLHSLTGYPGFTDSQNGGTAYACMYSNANGNLTTGNVGTAYNSFNYSCP